MLQSYYKYNDNPRSVKQAWAKRYSSDNLDDKIITVLKYTAVIRKMG